MRNIYLVVILSIFMFGCSSKPVLNIEKANIPSNIDGTKRSMENVQKAIIAAAVKRGWSPKIVQPGLIEASLSVRTHRATVDIPFSESNFNINYKSSENLNYNGTKIHRNYNNWIIKLSSSIQKELVNQSR